MSESSAIDLIMGERQRQIDKGYTAEHDDMHTQSEIVETALAFALHAAHNSYAPRCGVCGSFGFLPHSMCNITEADRSIPGLVKAAAMLVAEIERLQRLQASKAEGKSDV